MDTAEHRGSARKTKRLPVEIPESAREMKAHFQTKPDRTLVLGIAKFVSETGLAHMHPAVTYMEVPKDEEVHLLEKFSLVEKFKHDIDRWCVCAACNHDYPQFKDDGAICWLPRLGVIAIVGWDCFSSHSPEAHAAAEKRFVAEKKARSDEAFLLDQIPLVPRLLEALSSDKIVVEAIAEVRARFHGALHVHELHELDRYMRKGQLQTIEQVKRHTHGKNTATTVHLKTNFGRIEGAEFLNRHGDAIVDDLASVERKLRKLAFGETWSRIVKLMPDNEKADHAKNLATAVRTWSGVRGMAEKMQRFLGPATGKTIQRWSEQTGCPCRFYFEYADAEIRVGRSRREYSVIPIPVAALEPLSRLELKFDRIGRKRVYVGERQITSPAPVPMSVDGANID